MLVKVAGFSQDMDFNDGSVTNFVVLELPNGTTVRAIVSDEGARHLIEARTAAGPMPAAPTPEMPASHHPHAEVNEDGAVVFGGSGGEDDEDGEDPPQMFWPGPSAPEASPPPPAPPAASAYAHQDPATQQRLYREHQAELKRRAKKGPTMGRTVQKDEFGYPLPARNGGADPREIVGGGGVGAVDEDGVGQA